VVLVALAVLGVWAQAVVVPMTRMCGWTGADGGGPGAAPMDATRAPVKSRRTRHHAQQAADAVAVGQGRCGACVRPRHRSAPALAVYTVHARDRPSSTAGERGGGSSSSSSSLARPPARTRPVGSAHRGRDAGCVDSSCSGPFTLRARPVPACLCSAPG
jgi:hypothetical protein